MKQIKTYYQFHSDFDKRDLEYYLSKNFQYIKAGDKIRLQQVKLKVTEIVHDVSSNTIEYYLNLC